MFNITSSLKSTFPNAHAGILVMRGATSPPSPSTLPGTRPKGEESRADENRV